MSDKAVALAISAATGSAVAPCSTRPVSGGCINNSQKMEWSDGRCYFVKSAPSAEAERMYAAEAAGLRELGAAKAIRTPEPICWGVAEGSAYLALEWLELGGRGSEVELGRQLAAIHRVTRAEYGWYRDNTIGATAQPNRWMSDWSSFWREQRLGYQLRLAAGNGYSGRLARRGEQLIDRLPALFSDYHPAASLLHGDLWGGNVATTRAGEPVIFDPAVYFGDRECDLAMTELFGGFAPRFYDAYREAWPLDPGYRVRKRLYNLYHILNHLNLFGGGYAAQAEQMIEQLLAELN